MVGLSRRRILQGGAVGAGSIGIGGLRRARAQQSGPIQVPMLLPLSGPVAVVGIPSRQGAEILAALVNKTGGINGRNVEPLFVDSKASPYDAVAAARDVIGAGHSIIGGGLLTSELLALQPVLEGTKTVMISSGGSAPSFTHEHFSRYLFPATDNDTQRMRAMAQLSVEKSPDATLFDGAISDSGYYVQSYASFQHYASQAYGATGKVPSFNAPIVAKLGTTDFHGPLSALSSSKADAFFTYVIGSDAISLWQQAKAFNLNGKYKVVIDQALDFSLLKTLKSAMPANLWTNVFWYHGLNADDPLSSDFYKEYVARTGDTMPSAYLNYGYVSLAAIVETLRRADGRTGSEFLIPLIESMTFKTLKGNAYFRKEDHLLMGDLHFVQPVPLGEPPFVRIASAAKFDGAKLSPPPDPGKPFAL